MAKCSTRAVLFVFALLPMSYPAVGGEVEGGIGGCKIASALTSCEWKPSDCSKPSAPIIFASSVSAYNRSVDDYNFYLSAVDAYKNCIIAEGKADISEQFPAMVVKGAKSMEEEVDRDAEDAKEMLDLARTSIRN